jgi:hypothetical protein
MTMDEAFRRMVLGQSHAQMPSSPELFQNLAKEGVRWLKAGMPLLPQEVAQERLSLCKVCEFYVGARCSKCGCQMKVKTTLATSSCPIGKWGAVTEKMVPTENQTSPPAS